MILQFVTREVKGWHFCAAIFYRRNSTLSSGVIDKVWHLMQKFVSLSWLLHYFQCQKSSQLASLTPTLSLKMKMQYEHIPARWRLTQLKAKVKSQSFLIHLLYLIKCERKHFVGVVNLVQNMNGLKKWRSSISQWIKNEAGSKQLEYKQSKEKCQTCLKYFGL